MLRTTRTDVHGAEIEVSVVMPCLNEEQTIASCIRKAQESFRKLDIDGEVIVADNGSSDRSVATAESLGARVVHQPVRGYGSAYHKGIAAARGQYIVMGDADDTYDFSNLEPLLQPLREGYEFVIGDRFTKTLNKQAMPWLHRYVGTPLLSGVLRWWFQVRVHDAHCGMRAFTRDAYDRLHLQTTGMEYASEMIVNAGRAQLKIKEIPISYRVRRGESKLRTFRDGWRHLRFMLLYSPRYLFILPGLAMFFVGLGLLLLMYFRPIQIGEFVFDLHPMFLASLLALLGYQIASLGFYTKLYSFVQGLDTPDPIIRWFSRKFKLETMIAVGILVIGTGVAFGVSAFLAWVRSDFGALFEVKKSLISLTLTILGVQTMFSAFFYSILSIGLRRNLENGVRMPMVPPDGARHDIGTTPAPAASDAAVTASDAPRMRIAFVYDAAYPYTKGGAERRIHELAERLAEKHDVHIFTMKWWDGESVRRDHGATYHGVMNAQRWWKHGLRKFFEPLMFSLVVFPHLLRYKFDLLDCASTPYVPVISCYLYSKIRDVPFVVTWHEFWGKDQWKKTFRGLTAWLGYMSERLALLCSPQIVAVSPFTARRIAEARSSAAITIVANGVNYEAIVGIGKIEHQYDVLFVGRMIREKRVDLLLLALANMPANRRPRCLLIGEGQERERFMKMANDLGVWRSVEFRDFVSEQELFGLMKGAKMFVSPSEREGFGMTILEAQACGTPTIVVRHPENAAVDLVEDGVNGFRVEPDPAALAKALMEVMNNRELGDRLREGARRSARGFDWGALTHDLENFYRLLVFQDQRAL